MGIKASDLEVGKTIKVTYPKNICMKTGFNYVKGIITKVADDKSAVRVIGYNFNEKYKVADKVQLHTFTIMTTRSEFIKDEPSVTTLKDIDNARLMGAYGKAVKEEFNKLNTPKGLADSVVRRLSNNISSSGAGLVVQFPEGHLYFQGVDKKLEMVISMTADTETTHAKTFTVANTDVDGEHKELATDYMPHVNLDWVKDIKDERIQKAVLAFIKAFNFLGVKHGVWVQSSSNTVNRGYRKGNDWKYTYTAEIVFSTNLSEDNYKKVGNDFVAVLNKNIKNINNK